VVRGVRGVPLRLPAPEAPSKRDPARTPKRRKRGARRRKSTSVKPRGNA